MRFPKKYPVCASLHNNGFALVIALGLMSFIILLLLSITTFVRVETQSISIAMAQLQARENARLAAMQALGNLQRSMGPDQRVSFSASIFDEDPDRNGIQGVENPLWVAAVPTVAPSPASNAREFAEGNRNFALGFTTSARLTGALPSSSELQWLVSQPRLIENPADPIEQSASDIADADVVEIARRRSSIRDAGGSEIVEEYRVEVGVVPLSSGTGSSSGGFGWWVEDEGMKSQFNLVDRDPSFSDTAFQAPLSANLYGLLQKRQSNFAHAGVSDPAFATLVNDGRLERITSRGDLSVLDETWERWIEDRSADIGFGSLGVSVDVVEGRLKQDLTVYLETGIGLNDNSDIIHGGSGDTFYTNKPGYVSSSNNLPKFGVLRGWHDLGERIANGNVSSQAQTESEHGFHPNVVRAGMRIVAVVDGPLPERELDDSDPPNVISNPQPVDMFLLIAPYVELWNPYSVPIPPERYLVELSLPRLFRIGLNRGFNSASLDAGGNEILETFDLSLVGQDSSYAFGGNRGWIRMVIDTNDLLSGGQGIMPGESVLFSPVPAPEPIEYEDQPASAFNSGSDVNLLQNEFDFMEELLNPNMYFVFPQTITVELDHAEEDYGSDIVNFDDPDAGIYHRLSLLTSGPELLSLSNPLQMHFERFTQQRAGQRSVNQLAYRDGSIWNLPSTALSKNYHRVAWVAANAGNSNAGGTQHGGGRKITHRNPRQGFLLENLSGSEWFSLNFPWDHRSHLFFQDAWSNIGPLQARWRSNRNGPWGNLGMVDGFSQPNRTGNVDWQTSGTIAAHYDFPRRYGPIHSLGQLKHANLNPFPFGPSYVVGYSRAPFAIPDRSEIEEDNDTILPNERLDIAYATNASLWDRFYLSTIPQSDDFNPAAEGLVLPNNQMRIVPSFDGSFPSASDMRNSSDAFNESAANVLVEGAFNINSTSVEAWKAFLLSKAGLTMETGFGGNKGAFGSTYNTGGEDEIVLFPRFAEPVFGKAGDVSFNDGDARADAFYRAGLHITNRESIRRLAETIVAEVKRRGPFLSMADFINRRLDSTTTTDGNYAGMMGTLEAAIHRVSQDDDLLNNQLIDGDAVGGNRGTRLQIGVNPVPYSGNELQRYWGVPEGTRETALEGFPSYLMQSDILSHLGSSMTARSDTFTIHGYGKTTDPVSGRTIAEARCEIVVQRIAEPVEPGNSIRSPDGAFGRRFTIVAFRWIQ